MNTNTQIDKIDKVLSKISGKEIKAFVWQYAATHEDFATALVEKYWKPERGNYKEQVEACFAHADVLGKRFGQPQLDWRKIEQDLAAMMRKAKSMKKKGNLIDAALIAGYVMTITCREFKHDHLSYTPARYDVWAEENNLLVASYLGAVVCLVGLDIHSKVRDRGGFSLGYAWRDSRAM